MTVSINGTTGIVFNDASTQNTAAKVGMVNRIINGAMVIDQRNAGASVTPTNGQYTLDRWVAGLTQASKFTVQQDAGAVTPPVGFSDYLGCTSTSAYSVGSGDTFFIQQNIEGFNTADLMYGTANAQTVTLSFWVRSSLTGTFGGNLTNNGTTRSYPFSYTISAANTWEQKSITIAGDTTGTWVGATNGIGLKVTFSLGTGSTLSNTAGAWAAGNFLSATGATSVVGTNGATFYITGVQLEKGSTATSFDYRPYGTELALCQRYYQRIQGDTSAQRSVGIGTVGSATSIFRISVPMKTNMRAAPTCSASGLTGYDSGNNAAVSLATGYQTSEQISFDVSGGSGYTVGRAAVILTGGASTSYFDASAEL
jgi:hypothetical protein